MSAKQMAMGVYHRAVMDYWENDPRAKDALRAIKAMRIATAESKARTRRLAFSRTFNTVGQAMGKVRP